MQRRYRTGVVGGGAGGKLSMAALAASERFDLVALADLRAEVRQEIAALHPGIRTFASHQDMFASCPLEVVCVSTYPPSHREVTRDALALPLHGILVEKPLGDTTAAGRDILHQVRDRRLPLAVPHGLLVAPHGREIIERVRRGDIGHLELMEIECDQWDIINAGIHWLDFFVTLTGHEPVDFVLAQCDSSTRTYRDGMQVETMAVTYAQTRSGVRVVMQTGDDVRIARPGKSVLFRLVGTDGLIEFYGWENAYRVVTAAQPRGQVMHPPASGKTLHQLHLDTLAEQMDRGAPDYTVAEGSLMALEVCEAAYLSGRHRCVVTLPLERFAPPAATEWQPGQPYDGQGGGRNGRLLAPSP